MVLTFLLLPGLWASTCVFTSDVQKVLLMWSSEYIPNSSPPHPSLFKTPLSHLYHRKVLVPSGYTTFFYPWCSLDLITLIQIFVYLHHIHIIIDSYIQPACGALAGDTLTYHPQVTCLFLSSQINICCSLWPCIWCFLSMKFLHLHMSWMSMLVTTQMSLPLFPDTLTKIATTPTDTNLQVLCYISM